MSKLKAGVRIGNYLLRKTDTLCYSWKTSTEYRVLDSVIIDPRVNSQGRPRTRERGRNSYPRLRSRSCFLVATPAERSTGTTFASVVGFPTPAAAASRVTTSMMINTRKYFDRGRGPTWLIRHLAYAAYDSGGICLSFMIIRNRHTIPFHHSRRTITNAKEKRKDRYINGYRIIVSPRTTLLSISVRHNGTIRQNLVLPP